MVNVEKIRITTVGDLASVITTTSDMALVIDTAGTVAAGTLVFPSAPIDGQILSVSTRSAVTAVTLDGGGIPISGSISILAAGGTVSWIYDLVSNRWFRY